MSGTVLCIILCLFVAATSHPTTGQCTRPSGMMSWLFSTDSTLDFTSISHLTSNRDAVWRGTLGVYRWRIDSRSRQCRRCRAFPAPNTEQESLRTIQIAKRRKGETVVSPSVMSRLVCCFWNSLWNSWRSFLLRSDVIASSSLIRSRSF